jgi:hypothetical protein
MSSSQGLLTDPLTSDNLMRLASNPHQTSQLTKIGNGKRFYQWTKDLHQPFLAWWITTSWYHSNNERGEEAIVIKWDSTNRTSNFWQHFSQAANTQSGHPAVVCQRCSTSIEHPNTKNSGTKALQNHISSTKCRKGNFNSSKGFSQTQLFQTVSQV